MIEFNDQYQIYFVALIASMGVKLYLNLRNVNHVKKHRNKVPEQFSSSISLDDHQLAASYTIAKSRFGRTTLFVNILWLLLWTIGGGIDYLWNWTEQLAQAEVYRGLILFFGFAFIDSLFSLPFSAYSTFVIEETFGFNKTTPKLFFSDFFKGLLMGGLIGLPILWVVLWLVINLNTQWWLYAFLVTFAFQFLMLWLYPTLIAPIFNKFWPLEEGETKQRIQNLSEKIQFKLDGIFVMDASRRSSHGNAYFTGLGKAKRIVFFDTILKSLSPEEVEAVMAHELGHFKCKHVPKMIVKAALFSLIGFYLAFLLLNSPLFFKVHGVTALAAPVGLLLLSKVSGIYTFFLTPLGAWFSRRHEFEADDFAAKHSNGQCLIDSLLKLHKENASTLTPDPLFSKFYYSHPPATERIGHLELAIKRHS